VVEKTKLNNYTIKHNATKSIRSNDVNINGATDRTRIKITKSVRTTEKTWIKGYCQSHILSEISSIYLQLWR